MPRSRKSSSSNIGIGMSAKQMRRKKPINSDLMTDISPLTDNQTAYFDEYKRVKMYSPMVVQVQVKHLLPCIML